MRDIQGLKDFNARWQTWEIIRHFAHTITAAAKIQTAQPQLPVTRAQAELYVAASAVMDATRLEWAIGYNAERVETRRAHDSNPVNHPRPSVTPQGWRQLLNSPH